jgi:hypothetical protein
MSVFIQLHISESAFARCNLFNALHIDPFALFNGVNEFPVSSSESWVSLCSLAMRRTIA